MGKKTVKRLAVLIGVIALVGGGAYVLWRFQVERMARGVVRKAEVAEKRGDYAKAQELYREHLNVVPGDTEVQLRLAEAILKEDTGTKRRDDALQILEGVVGQDPGRQDVRRRAAEVAFEIGGALLDRARFHLAILLKTAGDDGHLEYMMGRCCEQDREFAQAAEFYGSAIEHGAPIAERLEAAQRRAMLLRDKLNREKEADRAIDEMVKSAPDDYRAYLGRGRYLEGARGARRGGDDLRKALQLAPNRPEVYLEVARATERGSGFDAARRVLDEGLAAAPKALELYTAISALEQRAGRIGRAVEALERGLKEMPDEVNIHWQLALLLAARGETGRLLLQVAELERLGANPVYARYLRSHYLFNNRKFVEARQLLTSLQPDVARIPFLKAGANVLLAKCYAELGEPEQQRDAMLRAYSTDPNNLQARLGYIQGLASRGGIDEAIREYSGLLADQPGVVRLPLAALLIERNRRLPEAQRQWGDAEGLIAKAAEAAPGAAEPALLRVQLLQARGAEAKALDDELKAICERFPADARPWIARAELLIRRGRWDEAQGVLKGAGDRFGDRVDLRLARAQLAMARGGPQVVATLNDLARDIERFSRDDRRALLKPLGEALVRLQDRAGATRVLTRLVEEEAESLQPRLLLFQLALQSGDAREVEGRIRAIEGIDEDFGRFCRAQHLAWQARGATDAAAKARARAEARRLLTELRARRPDWSRVPLTLAGLDEEELAEAGPGGAQGPEAEKEKLQPTIDLYRQAIELGLRDPGVVRHYIQLLFRVGRGSEALEVYGQMPSGGPLPGELGRMASQVALDNRDYHQAVEIARKAAEAAPKDFPARLWLAHVLLQDRQEDKAELELRAAVDANKADPERWLALLRLLMLTRQLEKAEQVVRDAESALADAAGAPLALAQCCGIMGKAYEAVDPDRSQSHYARARQWLDRAQKALKDPDDPTVRRRLAEFLIQTNRAAEAEGPLKEILARAADGKSPDVAWARRSLAQVYAVASPPRIAEAQDLLAGKAGPGGVADADDLRVLALIHEAQGTPEGRRQAIAHLEALVGRASATPADRLRLAQLLEAAGDWPRARERFRELILRTEDRPDTETVARRPIYLAMFVDALLRHLQAGDAADMAGARQLAEKVKPLPGGALASLVLEVHIDKAANQVGAAQARIREFADRPGVATADRIRLATVAEQLRLFDAAEAVYRRVAAEPPVEENRLRLALYLARHGRVKDGVDICEALWADPARREKVAAACVEILGDPKIAADVAQTQRVIGWLERAWGESPQSAIFVIGLANLYERRGDYLKAEELYRKAVQGNQRGEMAANAANNLAWLIALKGDRGDEALKLINNAIRLRGPIPEFLDTRGMIYLNAGEGRRAVVDLETALKAAPTPPKYFHLAQAYLKLDEKEKARKLLEAGKSRGLPGGLHRLELAAYNRVAGELGRP